MRDQTLRHPDAQTQRVIPSVDGEVIRVKLRRYVHRRRKPPPVVPPLVDLRLPGQPTIGMVPWSF